MRLADAMADQKRTLYFDMGFGPLNSKPAARDGKPQATSPWYKGSSAPGAPRPMAGSPKDHSSPAPLLPAVSLPKGGGAIQGIGEKFSTNPANGTGSLSVPIATSPGRNGFELGLSLGYDSGTGNGPFGLGWSLSVPNITRKTDKGLPRYFDEGDASDVFILSGAEDLVPIPDEVFEQSGYKIERFRPRTEGLFARIERWTLLATSDIHWRSITRENVLSIFGRSPEARVTHPQYAAAIFSWLLEETRDDRGNVVRYSYKQENGQGVEPTVLSEETRFEYAKDVPPLFTAKSQRYLKRIQYGNVAPVADRHTALPEDEEAYHFEVVFDYGEHDDESPTPEEVRPWSVRADPFSTCRPGFDLRTYRLCRRALMFHRIPELGDGAHLVRSTDFTYDEGPVVTYLSRVTLAAYKPSTSGALIRDTLPPLDLEYQRPEFNFEPKEFDAKSLEGIRRGTDAVAQWVDLDGEGIPGLLLSQGRAWFYKSNLGGGTLGPPVIQRAVPSPANLAASQQLIDVDSDGALELVRFKGPRTGTFCDRTPDGNWQAERVFWRTPSIDWDDPNLRFIDLDGDGQADLLVSEQNAFTWYDSMGEQGFGPPQRRPWMNRFECNYPTILFSDEHCAILLADMTGDGLADIVRIRHFDICYWPNLGRGQFGRQIRLRLKKPLDGSGQFDPKRVHLFDLDGSGTSDLVYADTKGTIQVYFNQAGNSLSAPVLVTTLPPCWPGASLSVADLLGNGTGCLIWSAFSGIVKNIPVLKYLDLLGGKKPHLLKRVVNNLGAETSIEYASSTKFFLEDKANGHPWLTKLPFPVQVIERVETRDQVSGSALVTRYAYRHGCYDGKEREYRGFARVDQWDAETFCEGAGELTTPPTHTVSWFHTGAWLGREKLERELAKEYYALDSKAPLLADTGRLIFTSGEPILSAHHQLEAVRAMRGQLLRQEIYGEDGTPQAIHPYLVKELDYEAIQYLKSALKTKGVTFVHPVNTLSLHYERHPEDPRMAQEIVLDVDAWGNTTLAAAVGYPRRVSESQIQEPEQQKTWVVVTENRFANHAAETSWYRVGAPIESVTSELTGLTPPAGGLFSTAELKSQILAATEIPYETAPTTGVEKRVVEHQRQLYAREYSTGALAWADAEGPLPLGQITERAIPHQTLRLALTPGLLSSVYGAAQPSGAELRLEGGYTKLDQSWWAQSGRVVLDPERFYTPVGAIDPFGNAQHVEYDAHTLLPIDLIDPLENRTTIGIRAVETVMTNGNDYRVLQPTWVTDPNGNQQRVELDAFGRVTKTWQTGKYGGYEGDEDDQNPGALFRYDLHAWHEGRGPTSVHSVLREKHLEGGAPFDDEGAPVRVGFQHAKTWTDGFGREVMTKVQAEAGQVPTFYGPGIVVRDANGNPILVHSATRWVGTGRTVFDNKGNPVKQYEPFFAGSLDYETERELVEWGVTPVLRYDPIGRLVRTDQPNGSFAEVRFDAWRQETWDENDTVLSSDWYAGRGSPAPTGPQPSAAEPRAAWLAAQHAETPKVEHLDTLGRVFLTEEDPGEEPAWTWLELDIEGNTLTVTDARGNQALLQTYDLLGRPIRSVSSDAGMSLALFDVKDKPIRTRDMRGYVRRHLYDALERPTHLYVKNLEGYEYLLERHVYGERHSTAEALNLRTHAHLSYDDAGVRMSARYDFKGNELEATRQYLCEKIDKVTWDELANLTEVDEIVAQVEWALENEQFVTTTSFDALNRVVARVTPDASVTRPSYNEAGLLDAVSVSVRGAQTPRCIVQNIDYNAKGQRQAIAYGNGTATSYTYDPKTFRLTRQVTTRNGTETLQDLGYVFDPAGNIVEMCDAVSYGNASVSATGRYEYDALYRLLKAEGREHPGQQVTDVDATEFGLPSSAHANDWQGLRRYQETYQYDSVGNLLALSHQPMGAGSGWTRRYRYEAENNRLMATSGPGDGANSYSMTYAHDASGNMTQMPHLPRMGWNHANRLVKVWKQVGGTTLNEVGYGYDAGGQRVRKAYLHGDLLEERMYLGEYELYRKWRKVSQRWEIEIERQTLHVMDGEKRVAMLETKTIDTTIPNYSPTTRERFQVGNHLGSSSIELDGQGAVISYEEYHPYGSSAFRSKDGACEVSAKRYRYTGKERDEETSLYYHGARYYAPWIGRWTTTDPAGFVDGTNLYAYCRNSPLRLVDRNGRESFEHATEPGNAADILSGGFDPDKGSSNYTWFQPKGQSSTGGPSMEGKTATIIAEYSGTPEGTISYQTHHQWYKQAEASLREQGLEGSLLQRAADAERWRRVADFMSSEGKSSYKIELGKGRGHYLALNAAGLRDLAITGLSGTGAGDVIARLVLSGKATEAAAAAEKAGLSAAVAARFGKAASVIKWGGRPLVAVAIASDAYQIYSAKNTARTATSKVVGWGATIAGAKGGAWAGAKLGGMIALGLGQAGPQALVPEEVVTVPLAAAIGGIGGGLIGGVSSYFLGEKITQTVYDWIFTPGAFANAK